MHGKFHLSVDIYSVETMERMIKNNFRAGTIDRVTCHLRCSFGTLYVQDHFYCTIDLR
jgi:hypothetical protein